MSFPRYPKYKDSGVDWLGDVPEHWGVTPLKYVARFTSGCTPGKAVADYWDGDVPWASSKDLKSETLSDTCDHITQRALDEGAAVLVPAGSVLVVVRGMILLHTFPVVQTLVPMAINQDVKAVAPTNGVGAVYMPWLLRGSATETFGRIDEAAHGTKVLRMESWTSIALPIPPRPEQATIAAFLDRETAKIDALIAEQQRLIELLQEKRQAVISHTVTKGLNPDAPMKDSGIEWLGEVPEHWDVQRIATCFRQVSEQGCDELPILSVSIHDGVSDKEMDEEELERKVTRSDDRSKYKRVAAGDLVYNMMRAWQGAFGSVGVEGMVSPAYVVARPTSQIVTAYVENVLRTPKAVEQMRRHSRGITDFRLRLYWEEFRNIRVPVPPRAEADAICRAIASTTSDSGALAVEADRTISLLQERRSALISAAVTGQIDVRGLAGSQAP